MRCAGVYAEILQRGGWGGANMVFFKRGGGSCKQCQGEHWKITLIVW